MDCWVYESFLFKGENKLSHYLKWLTATAAPYEKIGLCTIVGEIYIHIKWNKTYCAF